MPFDNGVTVGLAVDFRKIFYNGVVVSAALHDRMTANLGTAKHLAVDRGISLSGLLVEALEERVKRLSRMRRAAERQRTLMRSGLKLGTKGKIRWNREDLHAR